MQWTTPDILQAICRTFLHSLWQGMIAAVIAGAVLLLTRRTTARIRYNLLGAILLLFLTATGVTFYMELPDANVESAIVTDIISSPSPSLPLNDLLLDYLDANAGMIMLAWLLIFLFKCTRLLNGFIHIQRIRQQSIPAASQWQQQVQQLLQQLGIQQKVRLMESSRIRIPLTLGSFKPCIYIPAGLLLQLPADQVETILLHELAHIRRKDYLVNILQSFADVVFFFNPALLWISARIREEREACCDDIVLQHTSHKDSYVHALLAFQEVSAHTQLGMALQGRHYHLYNRVKRMLTRENQKLSIMEKTLLIAGLVAITAFSLLPGLEQPAIAAPIQVQTPPPPAPPQQRIDTGTWTRLAPLEKDKPGKIKKSKWKVLPPETKLDTTPLAPKEMEAPLPPVNQKTAPLAPLAPLEKEHKTAPPSAPKPPAVKAYKTAPPAGPKPPAVKAHKTAPPSAPKPAPHPAPKVKAAPQVNVQVNTNTDVKTDLKISKKKKPAEVLIWKNDKTGEYEIQSESKDEELADVLQSSSMKSVKVSMHPKDLGMLQKKLKFIIDTINVKKKPAPANLKPNKQLKQLQTLPDALLKNMNIGKPLNEC